MTGKRALYRRKLCTKTPCSVLYLVGIYTRYQNGEEKVLEVKYSLPVGVVPTVDIIRSQLHIKPETNVVMINGDIDVNASDLTKFDEKCGVS